MADLTGYFVCGVNHVSAPVEVRERLSVSTEAAPDFLRGLNGELSERVLVSTCNRTELIGFPWSGNSRQQVVAGLANFCGLEISAIEPHFYVHQGPEAVQHVFRVASGLDSMVPGETQITGQMKDAFDLSFGEDLAGRAMRSVYQRMLHTAKAVRAETNLGEGAVSVSSVAVQLARGIFDPLNNRTVLLLGAGEMCRTAGEHFVAAGVSGIHVVNRTFSRAEELAADVGGTAHKWEDLPAQLAAADVVLTCTGSKEPVLTKALVEKALGRRGGRPLFLIDIAVPRDVAPAVKRLADVYVYNIDDLQLIVARNVKKRQVAANDAERIVQAKVKEFSADPSAEVGPLIQSLRSRAEAIREAELEKLFRQNPQWDDKERERVARSTRLMLNRILHDPILSLRRGVSDSREGEAPPRNLTALFKEFFNL